LQTGNAKAIDEIKRATELNPLDAGGYAALGLAYLNLKKDTTMSKIQFEKALELDPNNADAYIGLGSLFEELNDPDKALENYKLAIKYDSKNAYAYYRAGVIYKDKEMLPEAVNNLFWAVKYNPDLTEAKSEFEKFAPIITLVKPQNRESIKTGTEYQIQWIPSNTDNVEYYVIWLIPQQGEWILVNGNIPKTTLTYNWSITNDLKEGNYTLRVYAVNPRFMQGKFGNWLSYGEAQITLGK